VIGLFLLFSMLFLAVTFSAIPTASAIVVEDVGFLPFEVAVNQDTDYVYVSHADGDVHVFTTAGAFVKVIEVGDDEALTGITVNPNTNLIYVANSALGEVAVIDGDPLHVGDFNTVIDTIILGPAGLFPVDVEVNTNLDVLYVSNVLSSTVIAIDVWNSDSSNPDVYFTPENTIIAVMEGFDSPSRFTFDPLENLMYMTNFFGANVSVIEIDLADFIPPIDHTITSIDVGNGPDGIEINPTEKKIYTANSADNTVSVIDVDPLNLATYNTELYTRDVGGDPTGVGVNSVDNLIFISNRADGTLSVIDGSDDSVDDLIPTDIFDEPFFPPRPRGVDVDNVASGKIFVANGYGGAKLAGTLSILDLVINPPCSKCWT